MRSRRGLATYLARRRGPYIGPHIGGGMPRATLVYRQSPACGTCGLAHETAACPFTEVDGVWKLTRPERLHRW